MGVTVNQFYKNLSLWLVISLMMILLFNMFNKPRTVAEKINYSDFITQVEAGKITAVTIQGNEIYGKFEGKDGKEFRTYKPGDADVTEMLLDKKLTVQAKPEEEKFSWFSIFISWFPLILLVGVWIFFMRQMQVGGGKAMSFGKSRAKLLTETQVKITFEDVAGIEEAKEELNEIISFLKDPKKFTKLGGRIPKGVLLMGPPGTGKTLLARAIAGEAGVPFFSISGSDFVEMFVGVGASRVRDLFLQGKKSAPCIIFIDEIDAVGRHRGAGLGGGHDEREQTLNQLLVEMDGFESNEGVILIAATNRPDVLDVALLRPGRFDRRIFIDKPDLAAREKILQVHTDQKKTAKNIELHTVAKQTVGLTGADLENICNEAAIFAAKRKHKMILQQDFIDAVEKVTIGSEKRSRKLTEKEKKITAYHELGHAIVGHLCPDSDPLHKISIVSRGAALGITWFLPQEDQYTTSKSKFLDEICGLLGGRAAEQLVFDEMTTGASNDIERASMIARNMAMKYGMGDEDLGPVAYGERQGTIFLGVEPTYVRNYSEEKAKAIDDYVRKAIKQQYERALAFLHQHRAKLDDLAVMLLQKETMTVEEFKEIFEKIEN